MNIQKRNPLYKSFGYAFEGIWTGFIKENESHCFCMVCVYYCRFYV